MGISGFALGVLLASIGYLWVPFGLFWTSLGRLSAPFGHPLSALWSLMDTCCASLAPLGCLGACFMSLGSCWPFPSLYGIIRSRRSMNMWCPDGIGRDSWDRGEPASVI